MLHSLSRTELIIGKQGISKLNNSKVIVFGVGGVGSFALEALARAGVGEIHIVDDDVVSITNINRQLVATTKTIGLPKIEVMRDRILEINPNAKIKLFRVFYNKQNQHLIDLSSYDYIIDAIDSVTAKLLLVQNAKLLNVPIISSMGTGNRMDPSKFKVSDISKTSICPLARVIRSELKKLNIKHLKVVYSTEKPAKPSISIELSMPPKSNGFRTMNKKRQVPASISFVPPVSGFLLASEVVKDLLNS